MVRTTRRRITAASRRCPSLSDYARKTQNSKNQKSTSGRLRHSILWHDGKKLAWSRTWDQSGNGASRQLAQSLGYLWNAYCMCRLAYIHTYIHAYVDTWMVSSNSYSRTTAFVSARIQSLSLSLFPLSLSVFCYRCVVLKNVVLRGDILCVACFSHT